MALAGLRWKLTQAEYQSIMGNNPSNFTGDNLPVENISWLDAVAYCNARSEAEGLTPVYTVEGSVVGWDRSADESNYWGDYPYLPQYTV